MAVHLVDAYGNAIGAVALRGTGLSEGDTALLVSKAGGTALTTAGILAVHQMLINNSSQSTPANCASSEADNRPGTYFGTTAQHLFNGTNYDRLRTPKVFVPTNLTSGTVEATLWTPAAGKKFRLMGLVCGGAGSGANLVFNDGTGGTMILTFDIANRTTAIVNLGNGILSAAANNVLTVVRGAATTLGITVYGTEE